MISETKRQSTLSTLFSLYLEEKKENFIRGLVSESDLFKFINTIRSEAEVYEGNRNNFSKRRAQNNISHTMASVSACGNKFIPLPRG